MSEDTPRTNRLKDLRKRRLAFLDKKSSSRDHQTTTETPNASRTVDNFQEPITGQMLIDVLSQDSAYHFDTKRGILNNDDSKCTNKKISCSSSVHDITSQHSSRIRDPKNEPNHSIRNQIVAGHKSEWKSDCKTSDGLKEQNDLISVDKSQLHQKRKKEKISKSANLKTLNSECDQVLQSLKNATSGNYDCLGGKLRVSTDAGKETGMDSKSSIKHRKKGSETFRVQKAQRSPLISAHYHDLHSNDCTLSADEKLKVMRPSPLLPHCFNKADKVVEDQSHVANDGLKANFENTGSLGEFSRNDENVGALSTVSSFSKGLALSQSVKLDQENLQKPLNSSADVLESGTFKTQSSSPLFTSSDDHHKDEIIHPISSNQSLFSPMTLGSLGGNYTDKQKVNDSLEASNIYHAVDANTKNCTYAQGNDINKLSDATQALENPSKESSNEFPPMDSVEFALPDHLGALPVVDSFHRRSQMSFGESNDFRPSCDLELISEAPPLPTSGQLSAESTSSSIASTAPSAAKTAQSGTSIATGLASTLNFDSASLELVLGKDRMQRLLKNILEIDGCPSESLTSSVSTLMSRSRQKPDCETSQEFQSYAGKEGAQKSFGESAKFSSSFVSQGSQDTDLPHPYNPQGSYSSLGLQTHRLEKTDDVLTSAKLSSNLGTRLENKGEISSSSSSSLNLLKSSDLKSKAEKMKCSFNADEIYSRAESIREKSLPSVTEVTPSESFVDSQKSFSKVTTPCESSDIGRHASEMELEGKSDLFQRNGCGKKDENSRGMAEIANGQITQQTSTSSLDSFDVKDYSVAREGFPEDSNVKRFKTEEATPRGRPTASKLAKDSQTKEIVHRTQQIRDDETNKKCNNPPDDSVRYGCFTNPALERYFKSLDGFSFKSESLSANLKHQKAPPADDNKPSYIAMPCKKQEHDSQKKLLKSTDDNSDVLFEKGTSVVEVFDKNVTSNLTETPARCEFSAKSSQLEPRKSSSKKLSSESECLVFDEQKHANDEICQQKSVALNSTIANCETRTDGHNAKKSHAMSLASTLVEDFDSSNVDKKPVFYPILNVRDSEEFQYSDIGNQEMGSFGEFFHEELSINLLDSGDYSADGGKGKVSNGPVKPQLKSILEHHAVDSVNFDYVVESQLDLPEDLKATLQLNLCDSVDMNENLTGKTNGNGTTMQKIQRETALPERKMSKSEARASERVNADNVKTSLSSAKANVVKSTEIRKGITKEKDEEMLNEVAIYRDFANHLANDLQFHSKAKSSGQSSVPQVPKLSLRDSSPLCSRSSSHLLNEVPRPSSSKLKPIGSQSMVFGKAKIAWKDDDQLAETSASVPTKSTTLRRRPWSAFVKRSNDAGMTKSSGNFDPSKSVTDPVSTRRQRPASVGPRSRRKVSSSDFGQGHSDDEFDGRNGVNYKQIFSSLSRNPLQSGKSKGTKKLVSRFSLTDYEKYLSLSPRIQAGELSMMTSLPDEILLMIFTYLGQPDLARCARVCQHFFRVAMDTSLWKKIELEKRALTDDHLAAIGRKTPSILSLIQCTGENVTPNGLRQLFWECAHSLKKLNFSGCSKGHLVGKDILLHVTDRCRQITHLDGSWTNLSSEGLMTFSAESECLQSVCLNGCQQLNNEAICTVVTRHGKSLVTLELLGLFGLTHAAVEVIGNYCKRLVKLTLGQCWKLTDCCLAELSTKLPYLETLDLRGCKQLKDQTIHQFVRNCVKLKSLSLANCTSLTDSALAEISVQCPRLRSLDICGCNKISNIGVKTLVNGCNILEHLDLSSTAINHRSVTAIASYCNCRLEVLKINLCKQISIECLQRLAKNCKRLRQLHMYGVKGLINVTDTLSRTNPKVWIEI